MSGKIRSIAAIASVLCLFLAATLCLTQRTAGAEAAYPNKPVEIIVTFQAGGAVDSSTRILAAEAEKILKQKILITNKTGGGGTEGIVYASKAKPDGYTLLTLTSAAITNILTKQVDYKVESFSPIMMFSYDPACVGVGASGPYANLGDLMAAAKKAPVPMATAGHSSANHVACVILENKFGVKFKYIHTKGAAEVATMVAGGHVAAGVGPWGDWRTMTEQGKVRVLGVMSETEDPRIPTISTFAKAGFPAASGVWRGIAAPKGAPADVVEKLAQAFKQAMESEEAKTRFKDMGFPMTYRNAADFQKEINESYQDFEKALANMKDEAK